jgi:hypothetical protein
LKEGQGSSRLTRLRGAAARKADRLATNKLIVSAWQRFRRTENAPTVN